MAPRNWSDANGIFWSIPKGCCSQSMSIRPTSWTAMASSWSSMSRRALACRGCSICGWIRATTGAAKAPTGSRPRWAGRCRSCARSIGSSATGCPTTFPRTRSTGPNTCPSQVSMCFPRRWVVERTFAWLLFNRRLSRDYERLCATSETWIYLAMIRLMVRRLARM